MEEKICYITTISGTLQSFVLPVAEYLKREQGYQITMICDDCDNLVSSVSGGIRCHSVKMKRGISLTGIQATISLYRFFRKEGFSLIQYSTPNAALYSAIAGFLAGVPVRLYCQWGIAYVGMSGLKRSIFRKIEKLICKLSTWIEPDSISNLKFAHSEGLYGKEKSSVIGYGSACGIDLKKFDISKKTHYRTEIRQKHSIPEESYVYGFVGRINRDKGINELLNAYRRLLSDYPNDYLMIVGRDEQDRNIDDALLSWAKQQKTIVFTGVTNEVEKYLSAFDCFVLPSYREGFGMGIIEAEAMEIPVVVSNIPGPIDAMVDGVTGLMVEKKNVDDLVQKMRSMKCHNAQEMGRAGRIYVEEHFARDEFCKLVQYDRERLLKG